MEEKRHGISIIGLLIRLILVIVFIFLLIWLFPMPNLTPLNNQIFADNIDRMKDVAKTYYTVERLPKNINETKRMTLKEMIDAHLILPLTDSNGKTCSKEDSYIEITRLENEYVIKIYLSCSDKKDYVITHFGCYDICSKECKMLETTTTARQKLTNKTTKKLTTNKTTTTKKKAYLYEFVRSVCKEVFDHKECPSGYTLTGDKCIKNGSDVIKKDAIVVTSNVTSVDKKPIDVITTVSNTTVDATVSNKITTGTITAGKKTKYTVKPAIKTTETVYSDYKITTTYSIITATKIATSYRWAYDYTTISLNSGLAYTKDNEKLVYITSFDELSCPTCFTTVTKYKYYHYTKKDIQYSYNCDNFPGYSLYNGSYCRKATGTTKSCPQGYTDTGSRCKKSGVTTYSCSTYGSDYKLDKSDNTCKKATVTYYCPENTSNTTYTLSGDKCNVKTTEKVYSCPTGTTKTANEKKCNKTITTKTNSCAKYGSGYEIKDSMCVKSTTTKVSSKTCDGYGSGYVLSGNYCLKTVNTTDTKNPRIVNKTICNNEYKWSTQTSLDGWKYTGRKKLLN